MRAGFSTFPGELRKALQSELRHGERVLYASRPDWRAEVGSLVVIFLFGLFWSSIAFVFFGMGTGGLLGLVHVQSDGAPASTGLLLFATLFSLPFVAIGVGLLSAPFLGIHKSRNTVHAVTDERLVNVTIGRAVVVDSYPLQTINFVKRRDRKDGTGSLEIGYGVGKDSDGDPRPLTIRWSGIANVKQAESAIRAQAKWAR